MDRLFPELPEDFLPVLLAVVFLLPALFTDAPFVAGCFAAVFFAAREVVLFFGVVFAVLFFVFLFCVVIFNFFPPSLRLS